MSSGNMVLFNNKIAGMSKFCKCLFFILTLCFTFYRSIAQNPLSVGTGTASDYNFPFQTYFNFGWSSQIYLASEMGSAGNISSLAFYVNNTGSNYTLTNQKIYLRHTNSAFHSDKYYPTAMGFTLVYDGSINFGKTGWHSINLISPFSYSGKANIELMIESRDASTHTSSIQTRYTGKSSGDYRCKYDYNDYSFPSTWNTGARVAKMPNIQFVKNSCTLISGTSSSSETNLCPGNSTTISLNGQTIGASIQWQESQDNINFNSIPGAITTLYNTPGLLAAKYYKARVSSSSCTVESNTVNVSVISTSGNSSSVPIGTGTTSDYNYPFQTYFNYGWSSYIFLASELGKANNINSLSFYLNNSGASYTLDNQKIYLRHTSSSIHADKYYPTNKGFNVVYEGKIELGATGWQNIILNSPFAYNGIDNIELLIESRDGSTFTSAIQSLNSSLASGNYRTKFDYHNYAFPVVYNAGGRLTRIPNVKFGMRSDTMQAGRIVPVNKNICYGDSTVLMLKDQTPGAAIKWQLSSDNLIFYDVPGINSSICNSGRLKTTTYFKALVSVSGCVFETNVDTIRVKQGSELLSIKDTSLCLGDSLALTTKAGLAYSWSPNVGICNAIDNNQILKPEKTTNYKLTAIDPLGCASTDSILVIVDSTCFSHNLNTSSLGFSYEGQELRYEISGAGLMGNYSTGTENVFKALRPHKGDVSQISLKFYTSSNTELFQLSYDVNDRIELDNPTTNLFGEPRSIGNIVFFDFQRLYFWENAINSIKYFYEMRHSRQLQNDNCLDLKRNWVHRKSFSQDGYLVSESRVYSDNLGRAIQSQSKVFANDDVMITQTVYDAFGRPLINSLPVPLGRNYICYKDSFFTNEKNQNYSYLDFDLPNDNKVPGEINNPKPVGNNYSGTLGWYYSNNNITEPYVPSSAFPYNRISHDDISFNGSVTAMAGEGHKMGSGHESFSYSMPASGELYYVFGFAKGWQVEDFTNSSEVFWKEPGIYDYMLTPKTHFQPVYQVTKTITIDQNGNEKIVFKDSDDKLIASCSSGEEDGLNKKVMNVTSIIPIKAGESYVDIHLPAGCESSLSLENNSASPFIKYNILNLKTGSYLKFDGEITFSGTKPILNPGLYRIIYLEGAINTVSGLTVNYNLNYYDFTLNYYDKANRLISSVPPLGVDQKQDLSFLRSSKSQKNGFNTNDPVSLDKTSFSNNEFGFSIIPDSARTQFTTLQVSLRKKTTDFDSNYESKYSFLDKSISSSILEKDLAVIPQYSSYTREFSQYEYDLYNEEMQLLQKQSNEQVTSDNYSRSAFIMPAYKPLETYAEPVKSDAGERDWKYKAEIKFKLIDQDNNNFKMVGDYYNTNLGTIEVHVVEKKVGIPGNQDYRVYNTYKFINSPVQAIIDPDLSKTATQAKIQVVSISGQAYTRKYDDPRFGDAGYGVISDYNPVFLKDLELLLDGITYKMIKEPLNTMQSKSSYNSLGQVLSTQSPDVGLTHYVYRNDGLLRFSENSLQRKNRKFSYYNFDNLGRVIETGEYTNDSDGYFFQSHQQVAELNHHQSNSIFNLSHDYLISGSQCASQTFFSYDNPRHPNPMGYKEQYITGKIAESWNDISKTWYSYDDLGRASWVIKQVDGLNPKSINYKYNIKGKLVEIAYQQENPEEDFYHFYSYDLSGRIQKTETSTDGINRKLQAKYVYYRHGQLKRVELGGDLQGIDYIYTINGWLKSINDPTLSHLDMGKDAYPGKNNSFAKDVFGMSLDYFSGDYSRSNTSVQSINTSRLLPSSDTGELHRIDESPDLFNGNVKTHRWQTRNDLDLSYSGQQLAKTYQYDSKNQLKQALFGTLAYNGMDNGSKNIASHYSSENQFIPSLDYKEWGIEYDPNGNLMKLNRNANQKIIDSKAYSRDVDKFEYIYKLDSNRRIDNKLSHITDEINDSTGLSDITSQTVENYKYDHLGQLIQNTKENTKLTYNSYGKVTEVSSLSGALLSSYFYDEMGQNIKKNIYTPNGTLDKEVWYLRDASGHVISIYYKDLDDENVYQRELPIYSNSRIGTYQRHKNENDKYLYELTDHLGSVRATFKEGLRKINLFNGFEGNGSDELRWSSSLNITSDQAYDGSKNSLQLQSNNNTSAIGPYIDIPVKEGYMIHFSAFYKCNLSAIQVLTGMKPDAFFVAELIDNEGKILPGTSLNYNIEGINNWIEKSASYSVNEKNEGLKLRIYFKNNSNTAVWFDNLKISIVSKDEDAGFAIADVQSSADYYAHGWEMPGRSSNLFTGNDGYRYGYQGQFAEKDVKQGWNEFEARNWDARMARWTSVDPAGQFHSPYMGMGNNPVLSIDPDGRFAWTSVLIGATTGGYSGYQLGKSKGAEGFSLAGYVAGGLAIGAISGYIGYDIATNSSLALSNTLGIASSSFVYSAGMSGLGGFTTGPSVSFGFASYNLGKNTWGYLGKRGNKKIENIGYGLAALTNLSDLIKGVDKFMGIEDKIAIKANTRMQEMIKSGHTAEKLELTSVGQNLKRSYPSYLGKNLKLKNGMDVNGSSDYYGPIAGWGWKEYAGYLHDLDYLDLKINDGAAYLLLSPQTIRADALLTGRTLFLGLKHTSPLELIVGTGLSAICGLKCTAPYAAIGALTFP